MSRWVIVPNGVTVEERELRDLLPRETKLGLTSLDGQVARVRQLLASSDLSLSHVASTVGFYDQRQMTHLFRRLVGATPLAYRLSARGSAKPPATP